MSFSGPSGAGYLIYDSEQIADSTRPKQASGLYSVCCTTININTKYMNVVTLTRDVSKQMRVQALLLIKSRSQKYFAGIRLIELPFDPPHRHEHMS